MLFTEQIKNGICHVYETGREQPLLSRYGFLTLDFPEEENSVPLRVSADNGSFTFSDGELTLSLTAVIDGGFCIDIPLAPDERIYGLGDESRKGIARRGTAAEIWISNVTSYGPIPYIMSSRGWGLLVNCTHRHKYDIAKTEPDKIRIFSETGSLDFFVLIGGSMRRTLSLYTDVTGKPILLPASAYGLTIVNNEETTAYTLLTNCNKMRELDMPCDIMGLEPSWMETNYDNSTQKKWNYSLFPIPKWLPENYYGSFSFIYPLKQMGYTLSLWLCNCYDIFREEERKAHSDARYAEKNAPQGEFTFKDDFTVKDEAWFEHLKKFADNGCEAFKLDGSSQVLEFPGRLWADRYTDEDVHNIYPLVYARQMKEGFESYTGKRLMLNTCGAYCGIQGYSATWAGDTGGGLDALVSLMNYAMCAHTNATCDMVPVDERIIHFTFLLPWTQQLVWANYLYPWFLSDKLRDIYRYYDQLRSGLFPYIYSYSHEASLSGFPFLRPLSLAYPDRGDYDGILNEYMLGDSLLVAAYDMNILLPEGSSWTDFFTGKVYEGGKRFVYSVPEGKGGGLFVKGGSIIVTQDWVHTHRDDHPSLYHVHVYKGGNAAFGGDAFGGDASFTLYDDDRITTAYRNGAYSEINLSLCGNTLTVSPRKGGFEGMGKAPELEIILHDNGEIRKLTTLSPLMYAEKGFSVDINAVNDCYTSPDQHMTLEL